MQLIIKESAIDISVPLAGAIGSKYKQHYMKQTPPGKKILVTHGPGEKGAPAFTVYHTKKSIIVEGYTDEL